MIQFHFKSNRKLYRRIQTRGLLINFITNLISEINLRYQRPQLIKIKIYISETKICARVEAEFINALPESNEDE